MRTFSEIFTAPSSAPKMPISSFVSLSVSINSSSAFLARSSFSLRSLTAANRGGQVSLSANNRRFNSADGDYLNTEAALLLQIIAVFQKKNFRTLPQSLGPPWPECQHMECGIVQSARPTDFVQQKFRARSPMCVSGFAPNRAIRTTHGSIPLQQRRHTKINIKIPNIPNFAWNE